MSSGTTDDRSKTRPLTHEELWEAWSLEPVWFEELHNGRDNTKIPTTHPPLRYSYSLIPPSDAYDQQTIRTAKYMAYELVDRLGAEDDSGSAFQRKWAQRQKESSAVDLEKKIDEAEKIKEDANKICRSGDFATALVKYTAAWGSLIPWHAAALAPGDPNREKLGKFETSTLANMAAVFIIMAKAGDDYDPEKRFECEDMAYKCVWAAIVDREFATAATVRNACRRAYDLIGKQRGPRGNDAALAAMRKYYQAQATALANAPKDAMYKDLQPELKIAPPPETVQRVFGPKKWQQRWDEVSNLYLQGR
ncbi:hypothetical protein IAT38_001665 [Cryptococcus sp. DSM 104549]